LKSLYLLAFSLSLSLHFFKPQRHKGPQRRLAKECGNHACIQYHSYIQKFLHFGIQALYEPRKVDIGSN
jgi:hypothetical protein